MNSLQIDDRIRKVVRPSEPIDGEVSLDTIGKIEISNGPIVYFDSGRLKKDMKQWANLFSTITGIPTYPIEGGKAFNTDDMPFLNAINCYQEHRLELSDIPEMRFMPGCVYIKIIIDADVSPACPGMAYDDDTIRNLDSNKIKSKTLPNASERIVDFMSGNDTLIGRYHRGYSVESSWDFYKSYLTYKRYDGGKYNDDDFIGILKDDIRDAKLSLIEEVD